MPENPAAGLESAVTKKAAGVPVWVWAGVAVVGGVVVYFVFFRPSSSSGANTLGPLSGGTGGSGNAGGSGSGTPTPAVAPLISNQEWLAKALIAVEKQTGMDPAQISLYLREYLAGRMPVGSHTAQSDFNRVIQAAIQSVGLPSSPPAIADPSVNPFVSNNSWLQNALGFLPAGISGSARQQIVNLFNGTGTTLSEEAAAALEYARGITGFEPTPISYTITPRITVPLPQLPNPIPPAHDTPVPTTPPVIPPVIPPIPPIPSIPVPVIPPVPTPVIPPIPIPHIPSIPPITPPRPPQVANLSHIVQFLQAANAAIAQGLDVNRPENYFPIYQRTFSWAAPEQIQAIQDTVHAMYANGAHPSNAALLAAINNVFMQNIRHPVPAGFTPSAIPNPIRSAA